MLNILKKFLSRYHFIIYMGLSFLVLDVYLRNFNKGLGYISRLDLSPNLFTLSWILLFIGIIMFLKGRWQKITYGLILVFFQIMLLVNYVYFQFFSTFFSFKNIGLAEEAQDYLKSVFSYIPVSLVAVILLSIALAIVAIIYMPKDKTKNDNILGVTLLVVFVTCFFLARVFLGPEVDKGNWDTWSNKRNIYQNYIDTRKSLQVSGLFEYTIRDIYLSKIAVLFKNNKENISYLNNYFSVDDKEVLSAFKVSSDDELRGVFKDKNLIVVLMESIDSWLVTEDTMPTLDNLMKTGISFTNHFSPIYNSGATFNAEFMVNTGYMTPLNGENASNKYGKNYFPYSLPNLFKNDGYIVNNFHENYSSFYNRGQMTKAFGYNNYYGSVEMGIPIADAVKDTHFMTNETIRDLLLPENKFMSFVITYSAHTPYTLDEVQCQKTATQEEVIEIKNGGIQEDICIRAQARETDNFFKELLDKLQEEDKLDNTVIIGFTDHYAYGYTDRDKIYDLIKTDDGNMISKLPFFIWSNDIESQTVSKVNTNLDILPTIAYLFGFDYNPKYYVGQNIFDPNYDGFAFFSDYSWYDGTVYFKNGNVISDTVVDEEYIKNGNQKIQNMLDINDKVLETNYFYTMLKNQK